MVLNEKSNLAHDLFDATETEPKALLTVQVEIDEYIEKVIESFDYNFTGVSTFELPQLPDIPEHFGVGVIVGSSGSGKTQLLKKHFEFNHKPLRWLPNKSIMSHFESPEIALEKLFAVGLASVPTLCKPYFVLSNGEKFRADLARRLVDHAIIDEYTSVVNRETAKSASVSLSKYIRKNSISNIVLASCHRDILPWLEPDWVFDTDNLDFDLEIERHYMKKVAKIEIY